MLDNITPPEGTGRQQPSAEQRSVWAEYREQQRREACVCHGVDPVTLQPLPRPPLDLLKTAISLADEQLDDRETLNSANRISLAAALAAISSAQAHAEGINRHASALESIAETLEVLVRAERFAGR